MKHILLTTVIVLSSSCCGQLSAQDVHYAQFNAMPLMLNPANAGAFDGIARVSTLYRSQDATETSPYSAAGMSFDMKLWNRRNGDFLAFGVQRIFEKVGIFDDGNTLNSGALSYHTYFGQKAKKYELGLGLQGVVNGEMYSVDHLFNHPFAPREMEIFSTYSGYTVYNYNIGASFAYRGTGNLSWQAGVALGKVNKDDDARWRAYQDEVGFGRRLYLNATADWRVCSRFHLKPSLFATTTNNTAYNTSIIAGVEASYLLKGKSTSLFAGASERSAAWKADFDVAIPMYSGGVEFKNLKVGLEYEHKTLDTRRVSAFEVSASYRFRGKHQG